MTCKLCGLRYNERVTFDCYRCACGELVHQTAATRYRGMKGSKHRFLTEHHGNCPTCGRSITYLVIRCNGGGDGMSAEAEQPVAVTGLFGWSVGTKIEKVR